MHRDEIDGLPAAVDIYGDWFSAVWFDETSNQEKIDRLLAKNALANLVQNGGKYGRKVSIGVGRVHYGGTRFIGAAVAERLCARGDEVLGIDNLNDYYQVSLKHDRVAHVREAAPDAFAFKQVDFSDWDALSAALDGEAFDSIVHLGAQAGFCEIRLIIPGGERIP